MTYTYRKDVRTDEQFKQDIKERTVKERKAADRLVENHLRKKFPNCYLEDNGCDNTGNVVYGAASQKADFVLREASDQDILLEMKVSGAACVTLKEDTVDTMSSYGDRNDVYIDWVVNFDKVNETHYIMSPAVSLEIFQNHGSYAEHNGFGNKAGWRLYKDEIDALVGNYGEKVKKFCNK